MPLPKRMPPQTLELSLLGSFHARQGKNEIVFNSKPKELLVLIALAQTLIPEMHTGIELKWLSDVLGVADTATNNSLPGRIRSLRREIDADTGDLLSYSHGYNKNPRTLRLTEHVKVDIAQLLSGSPLPLFEMGSQPLTHYLRQFAWSNHKDIKPYLDWLEATIQTHQANIATQPETRFSLTVPQAVPCLGRDTQIAELEEWLDESVASPVRTIIGPPGYGKTYLALEIAKRASMRNYKILPVSVSECHTVRQLIQALEEQLVVPSLVIEQAHLVKHIVARPGENKTLLILDGIETLLSSEVESKLFLTLFHSLISAVPRLRLLTTSHIPTNSPFEGIVSLTPLMPDENTYTSSTTAAEIDYGIMLVQETARMAGNKITDTPLDNFTLRNICEQLGRVPLFLFWAGKLLANQTPAQLLSTLEDRGLLIVPEHLKHRNAKGEAFSSDTVIRWMLDALSQEDLFLLHPLSLLQGSFTREAVITIFGSQHCERLATWVSFKLIEAHHLHNTTYYRLLPFVRTYLSRLESRDEFSGWRQLIHDYYTDRALEVATRVRSSEGAEAFTWLRLSYPDILVVLEKAVVEQNQTQVSRLMASLRFFWRNQPVYVASALDTLAPIVPLLSEWQNASLTLAVGWLFAQSNQWEAADRFQNIAMQQAQRNNEQSVAAEVQRYFAQRNLALGRYASAVEAAHAALLLAEGDAARAAAYHRLGSAIRPTNVEEAIEFYKKSHVLWESLQDPIGLLPVSLVLADAYLVRACRTHSSTDRWSAHALFHRTYEQGLAMQDIPICFSTAFGLARSYRVVNDFSEAQKWLERSERLRNYVDAFPSYRGLFCLEQYHLHYKNNDKKEAANYLIEAVRWFTDNNDAPGVGYVLAETVVLLKANQRWNEVALAFGMMGNCFERPKHRPTLAFSVRKCFPEAQENLGQKTFMDQVKVGAGISWEEVTPLCIDLIRTTRF